MTRFLAAALIAAAAAPSVAADAAVHAVLSADTRPYQEAWEGFRDELGAQASMGVAGSSIPSAARVVVAFGTKAALAEYPPSVKLIVSMAPSVAAPRRGRSATPRVAMAPDPRALIDGAKSVQPRLTRLAMLWKSEFYGAQYLPLLRAAGKSSGVEIVSVEIDDDEGVPDRLRALYGRVDAMWLPPDPLVVNQTNFLALRDYSLANRVPLYVPVPSLADRGATASIGASFRSVGREAAKVARRILDGADAAPLAFPSPTEITVNRDSAKTVGLELPADLPMENTR